MRAKYSGMLGLAAVNVIGELEILDSPDGFVCSGLKVFDFGGRAEQLFQWIDATILDEFRRVHSHLLWVHAAAVTRGGKATLIVGASGQGKSSLAVELVALGWSYLSDEMAPIRFSTGEIVPYPRTAVRRINPGHAVDMQLGDRLQREACPLPQSAISASAQPIGLLVFLKFIYDSDSCITPMSPGAASMELVRNCANFGAHLHNAVAEFSRLALANPSQWLEYGKGREAARALDKQAGGKAQA